MNQARRRFSKLQAALFSGAMATTASISLLVPGLSQSVRAELQDSPKAVLDEAWQIVNREYVDGSFNKTDWQVTRQDLLSKNYTSREAAYTALRKALEKLRPLHALHGSEAVRSADESNLRGTDRGGDEAGRRRENESY